YFGTTLHAIRNDKRARPVPTSHGYDTAGSAGGSLLHRRCRGLQSQRGAAREGRASDARRRAGSGPHLSPEEVQFREYWSEIPGFRSPRRELGIQQAKVEVLDRVPQPKERSTLRAVLGFLNYYRKFIPNFSKTAAALKRLLREDQKWEWGEVEQGALQALLKAVKTSTVLTLPNPADPFVLYTDWSSAGMGAILCENREGEEKVVAFASRSCNPAEANYSSYEGKGLAAVWAITHFRVYLQGRQFKLVTDHQPLTWLMTNQVLTGRNARWAMRLQEYDFSIRHRAGKTMQHVDGLSRNPPVHRPTALPSGISESIRCRRGYPRKRDGACRCLGRPESAGLGAG
ncbi:unnamed protein product, partial [Closterium sp. NIES-54]